MLHYSRQLMANVSRFSCFATSGMKGPSVPCHPSGEVVAPRPAKYGMLEWRLMNSNRNAGKSVGSTPRLSIGSPAFSPVLPNHLPDLLRTLRPNGAKPLKHSGGSFQRGRRFAILLLSLERLA
jgi:hypothetical protein